MNHGFIKLHRKIQDHWIYQEKRKFSRYEAWLDLLMMANHKDNKFVFGNELVEVKKGSFITSELKLMDRWDWGKAKLRTFLELLEKDEMIIKKSDRKKTTITICNYCIYHDYETENRPQTDHEQTTSRPSADTNKKEKNDKKKEPSQKFKYESSDMELAQLLFNYIQDNSEKAYHLKNSNMESWANTIRLMREQDKRNYDQIKYLIDWSQKHEFWKTVILSPTKLREQFNQLIVKVKAEKDKKVTPLESKQLKRNDAHIEMMKKLHGG